MAQYKIKLKKINAIVGVDIELNGDKVRGLVIAFRADDGEAHTVEIDGSLEVYSEFWAKLAKELDAVKYQISR